MLKILVALGIAGACWYWYSNSAPSAPTAAQVEPALRSYLESAKTCSGAVEITRLENIRVQGWNRQLQAWPVQADFAVRCSQAGANTTWTSSGGDAATCFAQRRGATVTCGLPGLAGEMADKAKAAIDEAMRKMPRP